LRCDVVGFDKIEDGLPQSIKPIERIPDIDSFRA
jgi:hypothetical protein